MNLNLLKEKIEGLNAQNGIDIDIEFESFHEGRQEALGRYDIDGNRILLFLDTIQHQLTREYKILSVDSDTFIQLVYFHEIGHLTYIKENGVDKLELNSVTDEDYLKELTRANNLSIKNEFEAWKEGSRYVPSELIEVFNIFNYLNMHYRYISENARFKEVCKKLSVESSVVQKAAIGIVKTLLEHISIIAEQISEGRFVEINYSLGVRDWKVIRDYESYN